VTQGALSRSKGREVSREVGGELARTTNERGKAPHVNWHLFETINMGESRWARKNSGKKRKKKKTKSSPAIERRLRERREIKGASLKRSTYWLGRGTGVLITICRGKKERSMKSEQGFHSVVYSWGLGTRGEGRGQREVQAIEQGVEETGLSLLGIVKKIGKRAKTSNGVHHESKQSRKTAADD